MKRVKQIKTLAALWKHRRPLWRMFRDIRRGAYRATFLTSAAIVLSLIYIISPIDLIPDFIPVVGWADDGFVLYFLLRRLMFELQRYETAQQPLKLAGQIPFK